MESKPVLVSLSSSLYLLAQRIALSLTLLQPSSLHASPRSAHSTQDRSDRLTALRANQITQTVRPSSGRTITLFRSRIEGSVQRLYLLAKIPPHHWMSQSIQSTMSMFVKISSSCRWSRMVLLSTETVSSQWLFEWPSCCITSVFYLEASYLLLPKLGLISFRTFVQTLRNLS